MRVEAVLADVRAVLKDHLDELLRDLVAAESVNPPGNEAVAAEVLASHLRAVGVETRLQHLPESGRANLVAPASAWQRPAQIVLCSHLDVVPVGPLNGWTFPPFDVTAVGDRLVGRGVCDAKGPLAVMALVVSVLERHLPGRAAVAAVAGEEFGGIGSRALLDAGFQATAVVIGEPTRMRTARAHKGRIEAHVTLSGHGGHAAMPTDESLAVEMLPGVLRELTRLADSLRRQPDSLCGRPTIAVTQIHSANGNGATIPAAITLTVDRRLTPGEKHEQAAEQLEEALDGLDGIASVTWLAGADPCEVPRSHPIVAAAVDADSQRRTPTGLSATCDQYLWWHTGIPGVVLGPGDLLSNRAHAADEHIERADLFASGEQYARTVLRYLEMISE
jgi:acetylornithine deacetylase/succinyl-diaminopimelate desuccinylase-like protein